MKNALVYGDKISPYYMPEITQSILRVANELPMWSNLINKYFKLSYINVTSAFVKNNCYQLKKKYTAA